MLVTHTHHEQTVQIAPDFYDAHNDLGSVYRSLGRYDDAVRHLWRARDLNANNADPLITLSAIHLEKNDLGEAERVAVLAVETDSRSALAFFSLGMAQYRRSKFESAETSLIRALNLAPEMLELRLALANVYGKRRRFDDLLKQLDQYLSEAPKDSRRLQAERLREQVLKIIEEQRN